MNKEITAVTQKHGYKNTNNNSIKVGTHINKPFDMNLSCQKLLFL